MSKNDKRKNNNIDNLMNYWQGLVDNAGKTVADNSDNDSLTRHIDINSCSDKKRNKYKC